MTNVFNDITNDIKFTKRPAPIPLGARMSYRIAQICLIMSLNCKTRESCSIQKIQTISNALFQPQEFSKLVKYARHSSSMVEFTPRVDPCVNVAIEFAIKYGICMQYGNRKYKLTSMGRKYVDAILRDDVMQKEKKMLYELGVDLTDELIRFI